MNNRLRGPAYDARIMRWLLLVLLVCSAAACAQNPVEVAGVRFEPRARIGEAEARLNGAGVRSILGFKLYAIGLYLPQQQQTLAAALRSQGAKRIEVVPLFALNAELFALGLVKGLRRNLSDSEYAELQQRIDKLRTTVRTMDDAAAHSLIQIDWLPAAGAAGGVTRLSIDGLQRGEDIGGEDFFQAVLKVWLGEKVHDARLRDALLGRASG